jgi:hypothetical protein
MRRLRQLSYEAGVSDIDEIRAKLRGGQSSTSSSGGGGRFGLLALATCAIGFAAVFLGPRILGLGSYSEVKSSLRDVVPTPGVQTSLPEFKPTESTPSSLRFGEEPPKPPVGNVVANYEGKSPAEIGQIADQVCFHRAQTRDPYWGTTPRLTTQSLANFRPEHMAYFNELLRCLLTEGTRRYCVSSERRMVVAEITMYFRGIASRNQSAKWHFDENRPRMQFEREFEEIRRRLDGDGAADPATQLQRAIVNVDQSVVAAIEYRLRDGLLTRSNRDDIAAGAPPAVRDRLARIDPPKSKCPDEPWWAFWR